MNLRRWVIIVLAAVAVTLAIIYGLMPRPLPADVVKARRGEFIVTVEEEGKTRVKERYTLSAPVAGVLGRIALDVGDKVKKGQTVALLTPLRPGVLDSRAHAEAEALLSAARAVLKEARERSRAAKAAKVYAMEKLRRTESLFKGGFVSRDELELANSEAEGAEAELAASEAAVKAAGFDVQRARAVLHDSTDARAGRAVSVRSPVDGRVLKIHRESEGVVSASEPLVDIGDPKRLEVIAEVLSADAVRIRVGDKVFLKRWGGGEVLKGRVTVIEPAGFTKISSLGVEEQRVNVIAEIISLPENAMGLGDGYRVDAGFVIWEGASVLTVPVSALFRHGDGWAVFVVKNGRAERRSLKVGHINGLSAEVVSGVSEGEAVIAHPDDALSDGVRVRAR
ncbi:MAG: efflux RND transporter periplasmic adaptor subunit [Thermodesulfobacteriota bacterium]